MNHATATRLPSERKFGATFSIALAVVGIYAAFRSWTWVSCAAALAGSTIVCAITIMAPSALAPLNKGWFYVGETMGKVVSPVVLGIIFFGLLTPIAIVARLFGRDELKLRNRGGTTYWVRRDALGPRTESFRNQF